MSGRDYGILPSVPHPRDYGLSGAADAAKAQHPRDYGSASAPEPVETALHGILRRIADIREHISQIHQIADHACGARPPQELRAQISSNGMLDQIEAQLDALADDAATALLRLRRLGSG